MNPRYIDYEADALTTTPSRRWQLTTSRNLKSESYCYEIRFLKSEIYRFRFTICHKTEVIKNTLNPNWKPMAVPVRVLCNGDHDRTIKVDVYDWDRDGGYVRPITLKNPLNQPLARFFFSQRIPFSDLKAKFYVHFPPYRLTHAGFACVCTIQ